MALRDDGRPLRRRRPVGAAAGGARPRHRAVARARPRAAGGRGRGRAIICGRCSPTQRLGGTELLVVPETGSRTSGCPPPRSLPCAAGSTGWRRTRTGAPSWCAARSPARWTACRGASGSSAARWPSSAATAAELGDDGRPRVRPRLEEVDEALRSGALLRGEVLRRWHEVVGTGDLMRELESRVGWVRDRVRSALTGKPAAEAGLQARCARTSTPSSMPPPTARPSAPPTSGARGRRAGPCSRGAPRLDAASPALLRPHARRRSAPGRATCSSSCATRPAAGARRRASRRSASTAPGCRDARRVRPDRRSDGCGGRGRGRHDGRRPADARGAPRRPGGAHARRPGARGPPRARRAAAAGRPSASTRCWPRRPGARQAARRLRAAPAERSSRRGERRARQRLARSGRGRRLADGRLDADDGRARPAPSSRAPGDASDSALDATVVALAGPTGAGKSSLFNALAGASSPARACGARPRRRPPRRSGASVDDALLDWLDVPSPPPPSTRGGPRRPGAARPARLRLDRGGAPRGGRPARRAGRPAGVGRRPAEVRRRGAARALPAAAGRPRGGDARRAQPGRPARRRTRSRPAAPTWPPAAPGRPRRRPRRWPASADAATGTPRCAPRSTRASPPATAAVARLAADVGGGRAAARGRVRGRRPGQVGRGRARAPRRGARRRGRAARPSSRAVERARTAAGGRSPRAGRSALAAAAASRPAAPPARRPLPATAARRSRPPTPVQRAQVSSAPRALAARAAPGSCRQPWPALVRSAATRSRARAGRPPRSRRRRHGPAAAPPRAGGGSPARCSCCSRCSPPRARCGWSPSPGWRGCSSTTSLPMPDVRGSPSRRPAARRGGPRRPPCGSRARGQPGRAGAGVPAGPNAGCAARSPGSPTSSWWRPSRGSSSRARACAPRRRARRRQRRDPLDRLAELGAVERRKRAPRGARVPATPRSTAPRC